MSRRTWLVSVSIAGHFAIGVGLFASGIWKLERLENDTRLASIGVMTPTQASGAAPEAPAQTIKKKEPAVKKIAKDPHQPQKPDPKDEAKQNDSTGKIGNGNGKGDNEIDGPDIDGPPGDLCLTPPCQQAPVTPPPEPPKPAVKKVINLPPLVMAQFRTHGETQIHPSTNTQNKMLRDGNTKVVGTLKVCIQTTGGIESVTLLGSTKYPEYDQLLIEGARRWQYRPYMVDNVPQPACSAVSFVYSIK